MPDHPEEAHCLAPLEDGEPCPNKPDESGFCELHGVEVAPRDEDDERCGAKILPPCPNEVRAKGLCRGHLRRKDRGLEVDVQLRQYNRKTGDEEKDKANADVRVFTRIPKELARAFRRKLRAERTSSYRKLRELIAREVSSVGG
jgi:hypothetical protein